VLEGQPPRLIAGAGRRSRLARDVRRLVGSKNRRRETERQQASGNQSQELHKLRREKTMENETEGGNGKEGTLTPVAQDAIGDAAKANVNAAVEVAKSAVTAFVDALTGEPQKPKRRSTRKKAAPKRTASKRSKPRRSAGGRRSAAATGRKATRKSAAKRRPSTGRTSSGAATRRPTRKATRTTRKSSQSKRSASKSRRAKPRRSARTRSR